MHAANLAFRLEPALPFRVVPAYDMLPMLWAPGAQGEIADRAFAPAPPLPAVGSLWREAAAWAAEYWDRVVVDARVSVEFVSLAESARNFLQRLRDHTD